jgi:hypothetical protein
MQPGPVEPAPTHRTVVATGLSNREFLDLYAGPGRIGLSGGVTLVDKAICRAERHLDARAVWGSWSHGFLFEGLRPDGHHWIIESDLQIHHKHIQLGVQENRVCKYYDEQLYTSLAVLDLALTEAQIACLVREALELVANRARYSLRELFGTFIALHRPEMRARGNVLAREKSLYCSALLQHLFRATGIDLAPGVDLKNSTPEDIARTPVPHVAYLLQRPASLSKLKQVKARMRRKLE